MQLHGNSRLMLGIANSVLEPLAYLVMLGAIGSYYELCTNKMYLVASFRIVFN